MEGCIALKGGPPWFRATSSVCVHSLSPVLTWLMVGVHVDESGVQADCSLIECNDGTHSGWCDVVDGEGDRLPLVGEQGRASALPGNSGAKTHSPLERHCTCETLQR